MALELSVNILCIFSWAHNTALAQANFLAWALGTGAGIALAIVVGSRFRGTPESGNV
jgi:hypothetical protein